MSICTKQLASSFIAIGKVISATLSFPEWRDTGTLHNCTFVRLWNVPSRSHLYQNIIYKAILKEWTFDIVCLATLEQIIVLIFFSMRKLRNQNLISSNKNWYKDLCGYPPPLERLIMLRLIFLVLRISAHQPTK